MLCKWSLYYLANNVHFVWYRHRGFPSTDLQVAESATDSRGLSHRNVPHRGFIDRPEIAYFPLAGGKINCHGSVYPDSSWQDETIRVNPLLCMLT